jgi:carboxymethylenebutenolidase
MAFPEITQDMISAYDDYTHLTLDRRAFMERLSKLAGSAAAAAAIAPMLSASQAVAAIVPANDKRLKAEDITYPGPKGTLSGYLVTPAGASGPLPAVMVVHENRGLNPHIEDVARRIALEGFLALAPDLLSGQGGTPEDEDKARDMIGNLKQRDTIADAVATVKFLKNDPRSNGKVGVIGFCWGGGIANQTAVNSTDLIAAVVYYGAQPKPEDAKRIKAKMMLHYAGLDERIDAGIKDFEAALKTSGVPFQIYMYDGVNHAFNNDTSAARYNKEAAELAWSRTVAFLKENLT